MTTYRPFTRSQLLNRGLTITLLLFFTTVSQVSISADEAEVERYPTSVLADYVLGCMAANGNKFESLHQCSCSIDYINGKMPYEAYEEANTIMQAALDMGQRGIFFRDSIWAKRRVETLERLQAESTLKCF